jgi:hypothetical protein
MTEPRPVTDLSPADWVVEGIDREDGVGSLLPTGFEGYARILHPAEQARGGEPRRVSWAEVAQANRRRLHRLVQFDALIGVDRDEQSDYACAIGAMPDEVSGAFCEVVSRHTESADECWFGLWDGWGGIAGSREVIEGPKVSVPGRDYILLRGPLAGIRQLPDDLWPSLVWPDDRAWCFATDIDLDSTYVGGSAALVADLLGDPRFESWPARPEDRVDVGADEINPPPRSRG